ncbi:MAG: DegT/DnrJ/EryC1/StrS family aminotransferase [Deltaproteobacteria bacterium]|nr:DegT/DnrJ/EryC1/StrS family aminotransferase [Deltaproteobacteria bacterium]
MNIPFIDLKKQQARIYEKIVGNIKKVLDHGQYIMGPEVTDLEEVLADYVGVGNAIACSSGTDALLVALMSYDVGPLDAIFTTPFTFIATAEVISLLGATPVFVDIDPYTFNIDPDSLELAIRALRQNRPDIYPLPDGYEHLRPRGIIAVDIFGQPADYNRINQVASRNSLFVIEDAAQAFGAEYNGAKAGKLSDIGITSFFPAKPLGTYGDGGMVFTDDPDLAEKIRSTHLHGKGSNKYDNIRIGINGRLDTIQAAILLAKFEIFPEEIDLRISVADRYTQVLSNSDVVRPPFVSEGVKSAWAQYCLLSINRSKIIKGLNASSIPTAIYYPIPLHMQTAFSRLNYKKGDFPVSETTCEMIFSIPMHPYLDIEDQRQIAGVIMDIV